eukprot:15103246-Ditylum_brightwellii.AAC.1
MINLNGISLANNGLEFKMLCKESMANVTDYMGYMETNLDTLCRSVTKVIHDNNRKVINQCKIVSVSSSTPVENYYKPGGIMSIIQGNLTAQVVIQESDQYG